MTYCCGWQSNSAAFVIADAAVTSPGITKQVDRTSFGELDVQGADRCVEEAALKVNPIGCTAVTFAGSSRAGRLIEECFALELKAGVSPSAALAKVVDSSDLRSLRSEAQLIAAYHDEGHPRLVSWNAGGNGVVLGHFNDVQVGSVKEVYRKITKNLLGGVGRLNIDPTRELVNALALCQSYGSFFYLMDHGVGGVFSGAYVDASGFHWQPDILYVLVDGSLNCASGVSVIMRGNVLIADSAVLGGVRVFGNTISSDCDPISLNQAVAESDAVFKSARYDYLVFLNAQTRIVVVVKMQKQTEHELLAVTSAKGTGLPSKFAVEFSFRQRFADILTRPRAMQDGRTLADLSICNIPYLAPRK